MGVLDFQIKPQSVLTSSRGDRPKAKIWLNIGYEKNGKFVNLPIGTPLDTMEPTDAKGQNPEWIAFQSARNALLEALKGLAGEIAPGGEVVIPNLEIRMRRVNDEMEIPAEENAYSVDFGALFTPAQAVG